MHYGIYRRYPWGGCPPCAMRGATLSPDANQDANNGRGTPTRTVGGVPPAIETWPSNP
jgi:hypothetical protein